MDAQIVGKRIAKLRKPIVIVISSLLVILVVFVIIFSNLKANEALEHDEGVYVFFDTESGFGVSAEKAKEIYDLQSAEDLRTQLLQFSKIEAALVVVNTAETSPFRKQESEGEATVSVILTIADTYTLSDNDLEKIANIIKASVPSIRDENIAISDSNLNYYPVSSRN